MKTIKELATRVLPVVAAMLGSTAVHADFKVSPGWDLLQTQPGTNFAGVSFEGVALGNFDFGGTIGTKYVGATDTIMRRLDTALVSGPFPETAAPIDIELVALQLRSTTPVDMGAGLDFYYVTLQSGTPSTGQMKITFDSADGGTFDSFFDVFFDIRLGCLTCGIVMSSQLHLTTADPGQWGRNPPPQALEIDGVNRYLSGVSGDRSEDFWPGPLVHDASGAAKHLVAPTIPEPETYAMLLAGLGLLGLTARRRRQKLNA